jgi:DNA-binding response OmpR family regulator
VAQDEPENDSTLGEPWPGFISMNALREHLADLELRGVGVMVIVDLTRRTLDSDGTMHSLDLAELLTLERLADERGSVVTRSDLAATVAGINRSGRRTVDAIVGQIRAKLGAYAEAIRSHYGTGYSLREGADIEIRTYAP